MNFAWTPSIIQRTMIIIEDNSKHVGKWRLSTKASIIVFDHSNFFFLLFSVCLCISLWFCFSIQWKNILFQTPANVQKQLKHGGKVFERYLLRINSFCKLSGERKIYYNMEIYEHNTNYTFHNQTLFVIICFRARQRYLC